MWDQENVGTRKLCRQCVEKVARHVAVDDVANESHKTITQINHTYQSHKMG